VQQIRGPRAKWPLFDAFTCPTGAQSMPARGRRLGELAFPEAPSPARAQHSRCRSTGRNKPCAALSGHGLIRDPFATRAMPWPFMLGPFGANLAVPLWSNTPQRRAVVGALAGGDNQAQPYGPALAACEQASAGLHSLSAGNPYRPWFATATRSHPAFDAQSGHFFYLHPHASVSVII
jgi:hypothetical protein